MERCRAVLRVPLRLSSAAPSSAPPLHFKVAASLSFSRPPSAPVGAPSNAVFFAGDRAAGTGDPVVEELSDPRNVAELLASKLGLGLVNAWVVEAPAFSGPFAVYKELVPSVDPLGNPSGYDPEGFPASSAVVEILAACLQEAKNTIATGQLHQQHVNIESTLSSPCPVARTILFGFSKGGVVINQILTELAHLKSMAADGGGSSGKSSVSFHQSNGFGLPSSKESFLCSISDVHYVDVGLNTSGAYITSQDVVRALGTSLSTDSPPLRINLHGTPRQWCDADRSWIRREKDRFHNMLIDEASRSNGKLEVTERFYYSGMPPCLQMHFKIIKDMDIS